MNIRQTASLKCEDVEAALGVHILRVMIFGLHLKCVCDVLGCMWAASQGKGKSAWHLGLYTPRMHTFPIEYVPRAPIHVL